MLDALKKLFGSAAAPKRDWTAIGDWAARGQHTFRTVPKEDGFVVDGRSGACAWRLEWGPSQRSYIPGGELRLRCELSLASELQALVLSRSLQESIEKAVFDEYVEGVQTRIDTTTPPEMRWLVMFPKLNAIELGALRERYAAVTSQKTWLMRWLAGPLTADLMVAPCEPADPVVLMIGRGRLMLRTALAEPDIDKLEGWLRLFVSAVREARRTHEEIGAVAAPSTQPSLWSASAMPGDPPAPPAG